jgi:hypothetical protein
MNKLGIFGLGFAFIMVFIIVVLCLFVLIDPFKETLDNVRGSKSLNCPGTPNFNSTDYSVDNDAGRLIKRPVCFVTGLSMVYWVLSVAIAWMVWVYSKWSGK